MATTAEQLASVQTAITAIEGGAQSVTKDGMTITRADLATLYTERARLLALTTSEATGSSWRQCEFN